MKIKTILLSSLLVAVTSYFLLANEDKEEARPEVRLAAAKETLLES